MIEDLHKADVAIMAWTVDSATQWDQVERAGVDAVITRPNWPAGTTPSCDGTVHPRPRWT